MLGKLIRYEFKDTGKRLFPVYILLLCFVFISKLFGGFKNENHNIINLLINHGKGVSTFQYIGIFIAAFVLTLAIIAQRFYKNFLKDEYYLIHKLPAAYPISPSTNFVSCLITAIIWYVICGIVVTLSIVTLVYYPGMFSEISKISSKIAIIIPQVYIQKAYTIIFESMIIMLLGAIHTTLIIYLSMLTGKVFSNNNVASSIGVFIGLQAISGTACRYFIKIALKIINPSDIFWIKSQITMTSIIILLIIFSAVYFFVCRNIINNKLNWNI